MADLLGRAAGGTCQHGRTAPPILSSSRPKWTKIDSLGRAAGDALSSLVLTSCVVSARRFRGTVATVILTDVFVCFSPLASVLFFFHRTLCCWAKGICSGTTHPGHSNCLFFSVWVVPRTYFGSLLGLPGKCPQRRDPFCAWPFWTTLTSWQIPFTFKQIGIYKICKKTTN
jgi:hypothetical protein